MADRNNEKRKTSPRKSRQNKKLNTYLTNINNDVKKQYPNIIESTGEEDSLHGFIMGI